MVIAALASFAILLVAWIIAPDRPHTTASPAVEAAPDPQALAA